MPVGGRATPAPSPHDDEGSDVSMLARDLQAVARTLESFLEGLNEIKLTVNTIKTRSEASNDEIKLLSKMLRDGDGSAPSVMTRLALAEAGLKEWREWRERWDKRADTATIGRWTVWASVVGGIISFIGAVVVLVKH